MFSLHSVSLRQQNRAVFSYWRTTVSFRIPSLVIIWSVCPCESCEWSFLRGKNSPTRLYSEFDWNAEFQYFQFFWDSALEDLLESVLSMVAFFFSFEKCGWICEFQNSIVFCISENLSFSVSHLYINHMDSFTHSVPYTLFLFRDFGFSHDFGYFFCMSSCCDNARDFLWNSLFDTCPWLLDFLTSRFLLRMRLVDEREFVNPRLSWYFKSISGVQE